MDLSKLDKVFSEWIRQRDADEYGRVKCCTCDTVSHWCEMDAGHFVRRGNLSVRFDERNCHAQCRECNRVHDGRGFTHKLYIKDRYHRHAPYELDRLGRLDIKLMQFEIDEMVQEYREKIRQL